MTIADFILTAPSNNLFFNSASIAESAFRLYPPQSIGKIVIVVIIKFKVMIPVNTHKTNCQLLIISIKIIEKGRFVK